MIKSWRFSSIWKEVVMSVVWHAGFFLGFSALMLQDMMEDRILGSSLVCAVYE